MVGRFSGLEVGFFRLSCACLDHPLLRLPADKSFLPLQVKALAELGILRPDFEAR